MDMLRYCLGILSAVFVLAVSAPVQSASPDHVVESVNSVELKCPPWC